LKTADDIIKKIAITLNYMSCAALAVLTILVTVNVILRKIFIMPILGTYDYTGFLTTMVIGCGLAYCNIENGHIDIGLFVDKMKGKARKWVITLGRALSFLVLSFLTYSMFTLGLRLLNANELSITTQTPLCIFVFILFICFLVFTLTVLVKIFEKDSEGEIK
jgi:TRAP-type C4-dicarboxylate transport system permease small subunit